VYRLHSPGGRVVWYTGNNKVSEEYAASFFSVERSSLINYRQGINLQSLQRFTFQGNKILETSFYVEFDLCSFCLFHYPKRRTNILMCHCSYNFATKEGAPALYQMRRFYFQRVIHCLDKWRRFHSFISSLWTNLRTYCINRIPHGIPSFNRQHYGCATYLPSG
jgi:hypothetical protein